MKFLYQKYIAKRNPLWNLFEDWWIILRLRMIHIYQYQNNRSNKEKNTAESSDNEEIKVETKISNDVFKLKVYIKNYSETDLTLYDQGIVHDFH